MDDVGRALTDRALEWTRVWRWTGAEDDGLFVSSMSNWVGRSQNRR